MARNARSAELRPSDKQLIKRKLKELQLTEKEVAAKSGLSRPTVMNVIRKNIPFDKQTIMQMAKALELEYDLQTNRLSDSSPSLKPWSYTKLADICQNIDIDVLLPVMRNLNLQTPTSLGNTYHDLLKANLSKKGMSLDDFHSMINDPSFQENLMKTLPEPDLIVDVARNCDHICYTCPSGDKLEFDDPLLLWDCSCGVAGKKHDDCPIHKHDLGQEVTTRYRAGLIKTNYREVSFYGRSSSDFWPPSIDTINMIENLDRYGITREPVDKVVDIGAGSGFLGILFATLNQHMVKLELTDWLLLPCLHSMINWKTNSTKRKYVKTSSRIGLFTHPLQYDSKPYDVVICNPPYLPVLKGHEEVGMESTVAGTDLLVHIITLNKTLGDKIFLQYSHLADTEAESAAARADVTLEVIGEEEVPFRIYFLYKNPDYIKLLKDKRGLIEKKNHRYPYWHRIKTCLIK